MHLTCFGILLMAMRYSLSRMQFPRALPKHLNKYQHNILLKIFLQNPVPMLVNNINKKSPVLKCPFHPICDSFLSCLFQRQSFGPQPLTDSITYILMKRSILTRHKGLMQIYVAENVKFKCLLLHLIIRYSVM